MDYRFYELSYANGVTLRKMLTERGAQDLARQTSEKGLVSITEIKPERAKRTAKSAPQDESGE